MKFKKEEHIKLNKGKFDKFVLAGDIGGTNTNLGIFGIKKEKPLLILSYHFKSQELNNLHDAVNKVLKLIKEEHNIEISDSCFAAAGPVPLSRDYSKLTNVKWDVSANGILDNTLLGSVIIINDFEAIGYGVNLLHPFNHKDIISIFHKKHKHKSVPYATKAVIGAGTGLGKVILRYEGCYNSYIPVASEGGHADFPAYDRDEMKLIEFIRDSRKIKQAVSWEQLLSGRGIENIYAYLKKTQYKNAKDMTPVEISENRKKMPICRETFKIFTKFYARAAKDFALECLALGGIYIAGGIAANNPDIFKSSIFMKEFENNYKLKDILVNIPVYIILNYNMGLFGSAFAVMNRQDIAIRR